MKAKYRTKEAATRSAGGSELARRIVCLAPGGRGENERAAP